MAEKFLVNVDVKARLDQASLYKIQDDLRKAAAGALSSFGQNISPDTSKLLSNIADGLDKVSNSSLNQCFHKSTRNKTSKICSKEHNKTFSYIDNRNNRAIKHKSSLFKKVKNSFAELQNQIFSKTEITQSEKIKEKTQLLLSKLKDINNRIKVRKIN